MNVAWLFPGQGSQFVGMGKDLLEISPAARACFERADEALDEPLSRLILEGPEPALTLTANAQPAILTVSYAVLAALRERLPSLVPAYAAGHSLGEYSALVATSALDFGDAVRLVRTRGKAMQASLPPSQQGKMVAVLGVETERLLTLITKASAGEVLSAANFNAPGQVVVSGTTGAVDRLSSLLSSEPRGKAVALKVSAPFHCALMGPASRAIEHALTPMPFNPPAFPVVFNVDARPHTDPTEIKHLLVHQVESAVLWEQTVAFLREQGVTHALEIGPGKVLAGLCRRIAKDIKVLSVSDAAALDEVASFLG
jgi:[acyl-carrier-protein] S-malonyltransferase